MNIFSKAFSYLKQEIVSKYREYFPKDTHHLTKPWRNGNVALLSTGGIAERGAVSVAVSLAPEVDAESVWNGMVPLLKKCDVHSARFNPTDPKGLKITIDFRENTEWPSSLNAIENHLQRAGLRSGESKEPTLKGANFLVRQKLPKNQMPYRLTAEEKKRDKDNVLRAKPVAVVTPAEEMLKDVRVYANTLVQLPRSFQSVVYALSAYSAEGLSPIKTSVGKNNIRSIKEKSLVMSEIKSALNRVGVIVSQNHREGTTFISNKSLLRDVLYCAVGAAGDWSDGTAGQLGLAGSGFVRSALKILEIKHTFKDGVISIDKDKIFEVQSMRVFYLGQEGQEIIMNVHDREERARLKPNTQAPSILRQALSGLQDFLTPSGPSVSGPQPA